MLEPYVAYLVVIKMQWGYTESCNYRQTVEPPFSCCSWRLLSRSVFLLSLHSVIRYCPAAALVLLELVLLSPLYIYALSYAKITPSTAPGCPTGQGVQYGTDAADGQLVTLRQFLCDVWALINLIGTHTAQSDLTKSSSHWCRSAFGTTRTNGTASRIDRDYRFAWS
jgi:hypothetical protein